MREKYNILLVEDDINLGQILNEYLRMKGYETTLCRDGIEGIETFRNSTFDLCILDVMMPKKDGFELAEEIKKFNPSTPFIFLTAKSLKEDAIRGLRIGADDYITKPFSMEELLLRMQAILKRVSTKETREKSVYKFNGFSFDPERRIIKIFEKEKKLTTKESQLLALLFEHQNETLKRHIALKQIWGDDSYFNARSMDVYITKLRKYIKPVDGLEILTLHGEGFKLVKFR